VAGDLMEMKTLPRRMRVQRKEKILIGELLISNTIVISLFTTFASAKK